MLYFCALLLEHALQLLKPQGHVAVLLVRHFVRICELVVLFLEHGALVLCNVPLLPNGLELPLRLFENAV